MTTVRPTAANRFVRLKSGQKVHKVAGTNKGVIRTICGKSSHFDYVYDEGGRYGIEPPAVKYRCAQCWAPFHK